MGQKEGAAVPLSWDLGPRLIQCGLARGLLPYQVASSFSRLATIDVGQKLRRVRCALLSWGSLVPIEYKVTCAEAYLHVKWHLSPSSRLATKNIGRK